MEKNLYDFMSEPRILNDSELKEIEEILEKECKGELRVSWKPGVLEDYYYTKELLLAKKKEEEKRAKRNKRKHFTKKVILGWKRFIDSPSFGCIFSILFFLVFVCALFGVAWLMELFLEYNSIAALIVILIVGNIGIYFFLYRRSSTFYRIILWIFFFVEVMGGIHICSLLST